MNFPRNLLLTALLASSGHTVAASSIDLSVKGTITPSACVPALSNGGTYDLGKISARDLNADKPTQLRGQYPQLTVTCEGATLMAVQARDNREGSDFIGSVDYFGLGLINGSEKLGAMTLRLSNPVADGAASRIIDSEDGGKTWNNGRYFWRTNLLSVSEAGVTAPLPVQQFSATLAIWPTIAPANSLTLTDEVLIDGSVTLTVKYL